MKKRIAAFLTALILILSCLPLTVSAEEDEPDSTTLAETAADSVVSYEGDDFARYGTDEEYAIVPCNAGRSCVDLDTGTGTVLQIWDSNRKDNKLWKLVKVGDYYYIQNKQYGKVVDVPYAKAETRTALQCYEYNGGDNQLWRLENMGDGTYTIHSKLNDSLVWNVTGFSWDNGAKIQLYGMNGESNERFRFVHTSTIEPMSEWGASRRDCNGSDWSVWDGSCSYDWYYNHKNERDLYINTAAEFFGLTSLVANGYEMTGKTIHLMRDINLAGNEWTPIGVNDHWFRGSFNGHNHAIIGLSCTADADYRGLFGLVSGGTVCNLAVKGTVKGDDHVGGLVGILQYGHLCNIYSEVSVLNCTDVRQGGICGAVAYGGFIDHCTQNAAVYSTDYDSQRGGIAGYSDGTIRYCVNNANVSHNWDNCGGIAGESGSGVFEFCANHGTISGGTRAEYIGGIVGKMGSGVIIGCFNDGEVFSSDNDYVGGIVGQISSAWSVICCINDGRVYGDDTIGGICGAGRPIKCLNTGIVTGDDYVGAISGDAESTTPWCYALSYSAANLNGKGGTRAEWVSAAQILSGRICYELNLDNVTYDTYGITAPLSQNIGSDPLPTFASSGVTKNGSSYSNGEYRVTAECDRGYGSVEGAGSYKAGDKVILTAKPAAGCVFDRFEVKSAEIGKKAGYNGEKTDYPITTVKTYNEETITLTNSIDKGYTVRAVFKIFDETPEDMKVTVKLELECTNDVDGWNNDTIPVAILDSAGMEHRWSTNKTNLNSVGAKVDHTFDLGTTSPVAVYVYPNFGGGLTFRDYGLKARLWVNGEGNAMESPEVKIYSYPFISSIYGDDFMHISFENYGNSTVGSNTYTKCTDAWNSAKSKSGSTVFLTSAWLLDSPLELSSGQSITVDLNGYPIIRSIKKTEDDGELFYIAEGATLTVIDSAPSRKSCGNFTGGSIQGGRSDNTGGLIECKGALVMTGGTLYNGGTTDKGGAIKLTGKATANLSGVLISNCWTDKAVTYQNDGGAIYMRDSAAVNMKNCTIRNCRAMDYGGAVYMETDGNRLTCENVNIIACSADENQGGGVYQDYGETNWIGGSIVGCRTNDDDGGAIYQNNGKLYLQNVTMKENSAAYHGGAVYCDSYEGLWLIGCTLQQNKADGSGGAIYIDNGNLFTQDCNVLSNSSKEEGGGIYLASSTSIGVAGTVVIRSNDGAGSYDNLVLGSNAYIYNHGLEPGSEIHLRSETDGTVKLGGSPMSEYQMNQYFRADSGKLDLTETQIVNTELRASVFSEGKTVIIIGAAVLFAAFAAGIIKKRTGRKGEEQ